MAALRRSIGPILFGLTLLHTAISLGQEKQIPEVLQPWRDWVTWDDKHQGCPPLFNDAQQHICFWPSRLTLVADKTSGRWQVEIRVFEEAWVPLPGSGDVWPIKPLNGDTPLVVVERDGRPAVRLPTGVHQLSGEFRWEEIPQRIAIPPQIGVLSLSVDGEAVAIPRWDAAGNVWLKRLRVESTDEDLLAAKIYRVVEDGIPVWLRTEIELTVSGRSREEELGWILPEGWTLSSVESPIPVAVNERGQVKAQVRAGKWTIAVHAFRADEVSEIRFAEDAQPIVDVELIGFRPNPSLRVAEFEGIQAVDVTQTTFPQKWRDLGVYRWSTESSFRVAEKMRGMGDKRQAGLTIYRQFWLDEDGRGITYRDQLSGVMQQIWRLDVADEQQLGAVRIDGEGQLITENPQTGAQGVEIRSRNVNLEAIGRMPVERGGELAATGWQASAADLDLTLTLPPGWRVFALFGADEVEGDWLTAWTLLDLFLLLIFSLAVYRLWGVRAGLVALLAFALAYHEMGSPRYTWFFLLIPLALLRVVPEGFARRLIRVWKHAAAGLLVILLLPFLAFQIQSAIYPQLEDRNLTYGQRRSLGWLQHEFQASPYQYAADAVEQLEMTTESSDLPMRGGRIQTKATADWFATGNMAYDPQAQIQTGPAEPQWSWNQVRCRWNGTVAAAESIRPLLISPLLHRVLTVVRVVLLILLAGILFGVPLKFPGGKGVVASAVLLLACFLPTDQAAAQIPDKQMLDTLRARLIEPSDAFPRAAEIAHVDLKLSENKVTMNVEVHATEDVAVPLPGRLPAWSPVTVKMDGQGNALACRRDGYLWATVPKGVHTIQVGGLLPDVTEWAWTFLLRPRRVTIDSPDWNVTGVRPGGIPQDQVFFVRKQKAAEGEAAYDQKNFQSIVRVDRHLEVGLVWKVRNVVTRLSAPGKAVSLELPLLAGERVLTSNAEVKEGRIEVSLGANQPSVVWESELPVREMVELQAADTGRWVERWHLVTSPVWNVELAKSEIAPVFESSSQNLVPVWHPWPGEKVTLAFRRPVAVSGDTITVQLVRQEVTLGNRERSTTLMLELECSLGGDFVLEIDENAEISSLTRDERDIPVRRDGGKLFVPVQPGKQRVQVAWRTAEVMESIVGVGNITLPSEAANVTTTLQVPESRWVLWAAGPRRGPAVRFWTILVVAVLVALALGQIPLSPLGRAAWVLLALGLTQVHVLAAMFVVGWLFLLAWRGSTDHEQTNPWAFNLLQLSIVLATIIALVILTVVVGEGLLGDPEMFIVGNGSSQTNLNWFQPRVGVELPEPSIVSVSVWYYRLLMLAWALWLAVALLRWLTWGWKQFSRGGLWKDLGPARAAAPIVATQVESAEPSPSDQGD
ncbi:MAG: hypothetical protein DWQ35_05425 [Planctomycetota bacterium]|nr:MAG: hypothetical protein DWQ35_05425 [Planctomycetota bacterium]REK26799.1 MAG: hypothetical protein DWQ42_08200 [Planctomycetota bacterium]REK40770.1 MAG: hypothetical protein DWQ46_15365 [Planctomycetota bacterium]